MTAATATEIHPAVMALAHAIRREIIAGIAAGRTSPTEAAEHSGRPLGSVSYHFRMLVTYGLIEVARTEPRRGALQHFYRFTPDALRLLTRAERFVDDASRAVAEATF